MVEDLRAKQRSLRGEELRRYLTVQVEIGQFLARFVSSEALTGPVPPQMTEQDFLLLRVASSRLIEWSTGCDWARSRDLTDEERALLIANQDRLNKVGKLLAEVLSG